MDYKASGIRLGLALLIALPSLGWAQLVPSQEPEPISYQSRLSELRKTEVALDAAAIAGANLPLLLQELDVQRSWAQGCVRDTEDSLQSIGEELTLLGDPTTGEDLRVTLERTRVENRVKVLESQLGGCRLLIVRAQKLMTTILETQTGQARATLLTRSQPLWAFEGGPITGSYWPTWANSVSQNESTLESLLLTLLLSLGGLILAFGSKTALGKLGSGVVLSNQEPMRHRRYFLETLRDNLPLLVVGTILWGGSNEIDPAIGAPLFSLGRLCIALSLTLSILQLWTYRRNEINGASNLTGLWRPVILVTALLLLSLNPINNPALSPGLDSVIRTALLAALLAASLRLKQAWAPPEALYQSALNLGLVIIGLCLGAEILGFRNLSTALFERFAYANLGLAFTLTAARALSGALTRWSDQTRTIRDDKPELEANTPFLSNSGTWVEFTISISFWTIFSLYLVTLLGYGDQGFSALKQLTVDGFAIGEFQFVPGRIIFALLVLYALLTFTRWLRNLFETRWIQNAKMERGARDALITSLGYLGTSVSVVTALIVAGVDFTGLAILFSALSVGIGFGLQNVVNNFVSGLILLFERPIKSGDWVSVGSTEGHVKKIRIRSTLIQTLDRADVIVPNSELISAQVTNWMLRDKIGRVKVAIGVAYGSDTALVKKLLLEVAQAHQDVLSAPVEHEPTVTFQDFGASSLDFSLRVFIPDIERRFIVASDLRFAIDAIFRENNIEIPFPQRDLHLRSSELPTYLPSQGSTSQINDK
ncbi:MAG: mechanosensitive ion channel domain-containing protein [Myxococcota bacterium]|nr:mechanosensitive ion channel domain-containing protein [Myxococcota bacterium]